MQTSHSSAQAAAHRHESRQATGRHYRRLVVMTALSFAAMYGLMYAMVDRFDHYFNNVNQVYMAGLMAAAMVIIELTVMGSMYAHKKLNAAIIAVSMIALVAFWFAIRQQTAVADEQFLRSMIPHHSGAILMCEKATIKDPELQMLCEQIVAGQASEISQMRAKLSDLNG